MVRPRHDQNSPSARDQLVRAFWQLLSENPSTRITVAELSRTAGVNKNTFYYHFDGIDSMSQTIVFEEFQPESLKLLLQKITAGEPGAHDPQLETSFERLCIVCSPHSTPAVRLLLKNALRSVWAEMLGLDLELLSASRRLSFEFAVGGVIGVLEYRSAEASHLSFADVLTTEPHGYLEALHHARHGTPHAAPW